MLLRDSVESRGDTFPLQSIRDLGMVTIRVADMGSRRPWGFFFWMPPSGPFMRAKKPWRYLLTPELQQETKDSTTSYKTESDRYFRAMAIITVSLLPNF